MNFTEPTVQLKKVRQILLPAKSFSQPSKNFVPGVTQKDACRTWLRSGSVLILNRPEYLSQSLKKCFRLIF